MVPCRMLVVPLLLALAIGFVFGFLVGFAVRDRFRASADRLEFSAGLKLAPLFRHRGIRMSRSEASETLLICDGCTLTADRAPEGKFKVRSGTAVIDTTILVDQVLELRMRGELIHALRKPKATDAYSRLEDLGRTSRLADDV